MVWQETPLPLGARLDAEQERELRLISQARAGAEWALAALVARYQPMVVRYLTRLVGDPEQARELAEQVFFRMERRLRGPRGGEYLRLWLLRASTEAGLDALRHPRRGSAPQLDAASARSRLLTERVGTSAQRLREGLGKLSERANTTSRQVRQMIWANEPPLEPRPSRAGPGVEAPLPADSAPLEEEAESLDPRMVLRHRMVRAVLAEIAYGDAQCLALHLVAGLNQAEVGHALGIRASAARRHIVLGLEMFAQRYQAALTELGIPQEMVYGDLQRPASAEQTRIGADVTAPPMDETIETTIETPLTAVPVDVMATSELVGEAASADAMTTDAMTTDAMTPAPVASEEVPVGAAITATEIGDSEDEDARDSTFVPTPHLEIPIGPSAASHPSVADLDESPRLVEPPLWQPSELADGALAPAASLAPSPQGATTLVEPTDAPAVDHQGEAIMTVAGALAPFAGDFAPSAPAHQIAESAMSPIPETIGTATSLEPTVPADAVAQAELAPPADMPPGAETSPEAPLAAAITAPVLAPVVVPVLSAAVAPREPTIVPLLTATSSPVTDAPLTVPVLTAASTLRQTAPTDQIRTVPVRTPTAPEH
ncbi:MAG: hypothetical protein IVW57_04850 [Ktedonobacterales bacterium]|nr:hypothetical protein [Ktedonobacterales bacterium]